MKHIQGAFFTGYMTIYVKGLNPELFFQLCINNEIEVWDVKKVSDSACRGKVKLKVITQLDEIKQVTNYEVTIIHKKGLPILLHRIIKMREVLLSLALCCLLIVLLSNVIWKVSISGVSKEMEEKISGELTSYGIYRGNWFFSLDSSSVIQQKLINDIPELLWVGVNKKGTTFTLEGVEKTIVKEEEITGPRHLIANKTGVIKKMYISKGIPKVQINDYVKAGDILVSGIMNEEEDMDEDNIEDKEKKKELDLVISEGEISANIWYKIAVTIPLKANQEILTGNKEKKYSLQIKQAHIPIWGFRKPEFKNIHRDVNRKPLYFWKWKLPIRINETILSEKVYNKVDRTDEEAIEVGIAQAENQLKLQLGQGATVLSKNVLHESKDNGKVKLIMYISVEEDIARIEPINQGD